MRANEIFVKKLTSEVNVLGIKARHTYMYTSAQYMYEPNIFHQYKYVAHFKGYDQISPPIFHFCGEHFHNNFQLSQDGDIFCLYMGCLVSAFFFFFISEVNCQWVIEYAIQQNSIEFKV